MSDPLYRLRTRTSARHDAHGVFVCVVYRIDRGDQTPPLWEKIVPANADPAAFTAAWNEMLVKDKALAAGVPLTAPDGRPYVREFRQSDDDLAYWKPEPLRDGDPVYCCGVRVGTFHGDASKPGAGHIETVSTKDMPPKLAAHLREQASLAAAAQKAP